MTDMDKDSNMGSCQIDHSRPFIQCANDDVSIESLCGSLLQHVEEISTDTDDAPSSMQKNRHLEAD